jgi:hypothetical protein
MKKLVVLAFFALGSIYFVACNKDNLTPDSMSSDAVSAATAADSTKHKHKGPHGDSLGVKKPKGMPHDSLGHKPPKDSLGVKPPKADSLGHKPKKGGPKKG